MNQPVTKRGCTNVLGQSSHFGAPYEVDLTYQLPAGVTYTRASSGTYLGSGGVLMSAGTNAPRFEIDPVSGAPRGLLLESAAAQLVANANVLGTPGTSSDGQTSTTLWNVAGGSVSSGSDAKWLHDVYLFNEGTANNVHVFSCPMTANVAADEHRVYSVVLKAGTCSRVALSPKNSFWIYDDVHIKIDLSTGTIFNSGSSFLASGIDSLGGGWYRCWFAYAVSSGSDFRCVTVCPLNPANDQMASFTGTNRTFYLGYPQIEAGEVPSSIIPNTTANEVTRAADSYRVEDLRTLGFDMEQGTLVVDFAAAQLGGGDVAHDILNVGTDTNHLQVFYDLGATHKVSAMHTLGGTDVTVDASSSTSVAAQVKHRVAVAYAPKQIRVAYDGHGVASATVVGPLAYTRMIVGNGLKGWISRYAYWPYAGLNLTALSS